MRFCLFPLLAFTSLTGFTWAHAELVLEGATLHSIGYRWIVPAEPADRRLQVEWRPGGEAAWRIGPPLVRVAPRAHLSEEGASELKVTANEALFAGSIVSLEADTDYELRFTDSERTAIITHRTRTLAEPRTSRNAMTKHVIPGNGGGSGTIADPYRGLDVAQAAAQPGDLFLLGRGVYPTPFTVVKSGRPNQPIIWRGAGNEETILEPAEPRGKRGPRAVMANDAHDVWFERLLIRNVQYGLTGHDAARLVVRHCTFSGVEFGIAATRNDRDTVRGWFITDNLMEGPCSWPRSKGIEPARGIQLTGEGHVIAHNRIRNFADGIDTFPSRRCANIDIHHNDISVMTDDGIELDSAERNVRCFSNRLTNVFQGISLQPVIGGPVYIFRNVLYNVVGESFKMHNSPSGAHFYHNTSVKRGTPFVVSTEDPVRHCRSRNNLFVGTEAPYACEMGAPMDACDFDRDGFAGGPWKLFLKWNGMRFATLEETRAKAPVYRHAIVLGETTTFAAGTSPPAEPSKIHEAPDLRLKPESDAIDAGEKLPGFNDLFNGKAPDLGAYELATGLPIYGPRPFGAQADAQFQPPK